MFGRIITLMIKEFIELRRDTWARFRLIAWPLVQVIVFGYAATFEVFSVSTAVLDFDHSQESRELISRFTYTGRFHVVRTAQTQADITRAIDRGDATVAIVIHPRFAEYLRNGQSAPLQVLHHGFQARVVMAFAKSVIELDAPHRPGRIAPGKGRSSAATSANSPRRHFAV